MPERREGQEGSRWINHRPTGDEVATWFEKNVDVPDGLSHADYVSGITLIQQTEKAKEVVGWKDETEPLIAERSHLVYVPYAKVETRVKFFHDLMALHAEEWVGFIEPVTPIEPNPKLPPGFFSTAVAAKAGQVSFVVCSMKVTVFKRGTVKYERVTVDKRTGEQRMIRTGEVVIDGAPAVKMVPWLNRYQDADPFALMKAETGAVGRALGLAGMLVIPGTGVATAEDMTEAQGMSDHSLAATPEEAPSAPPAEPDKTPEEVLTTLRQQASAAIGALKEANEDSFEEFRKWAKGRGIGVIGELNDERQLRGLISKAERDTATVLQEAEESE